MSFLSAGSFTRKDAALWSRSRLAGNAGALGFAPKARGMRRFDAFARPCVLALTEAYIYRGTIDVLQVTCR